MKGMLMGFSITTMAGFTAIMALLTLLAPSRWDHAVVLRICRDGTPILRAQDGSIWARRPSTAYRVEDASKVCER